MLGAGLIDRKSAMEISWGIWTLCLLCSSAQEMNQFEPSQLGQWGHYII